MPLYCSVIVDICHCYKIDGGVTRPPADNVDTFVYSHATVTGCSAASSELLRYTKNRFMVLGPNDYHDRSTLYMLIQSTHIGEHSL